jgi:hypothetical protein
MAASVLARLMLKNRIYRGEIVHKRKAFPGEHAAIVDEELWRRVQSHLEENRMERREGDKALEPSLLAGIVFDASFEPMTPTHAVKKGTRYGTMSPASSSPAPRRTDPEVSGSRRPISKSLSSWRGSNPPDSLPTS